MYTWAGWLAAVCIVNQYKELILADLADNECIYFVLWDLAIHISETGPQAYNI